jgi:hypothetical protein
MLSYKDLMKELYTPKSGDEKRFADKHVVKVTDYPGGDDDTDVTNMIKKSPAKKKRIADSEKGKDEEVYEALLNVREDAALKERYGSNWRAVKYAQESAAVDLGESKSATGYDLYHKDFSSAMQHAYDHAKKKHGITIDPNEIDDKVATGPRKPSEGKTNTYRLKGDKGAIQVQVYNKGGSKPFELNMYKEEVDLDEKAPIMKMTDIMDRGKKSKTYQVDIGGGRATLKAASEKMAIQKAMTQLKINKKIKPFPKATVKIVKESVEVNLDENFKAGALPLKDGASVNVSKEDARVLDVLFKNLNGNNRKQMMVKVESNKKSFSEILAFAKNVDERGN